MKLTKKQLKKLIQEMIYKNLDDLKAKRPWFRHNLRWRPYHFGDEKTGATHSISSPNMTKRSVHHALQIPPYDPLEGSNLDDETLTQLKSLRGSDYEASKQADELLDTFADPKDVPPNFGIKNKGYSEQAAAYDKIKGGISNLNIADSKNPAIRKTIYSIDNMLYDIGLGWDDHPNLKINNLLTPIEELDHDKAVFKIRQYLTSKDEAIQKELASIIKKDPAIIHKLADLAKMIEDEKQSTFDSWHKTLQ